MLPRDFKQSSMNPIVLAQIKVEKDNSSALAAQEKGFKFNTSMFTISEENLLYNAFDVAVGIFMLFTSYYYGYLAANRYHFVHIREHDPTYEN